MTETSVEPGRAPAATGGTAAGRAVTVVVLTWNGLHHTRRCLESLRRVTDLAAVQVIVVDNGSTDGTIEYLRAQPGIEVILNDANLGFVRGNNAALRTVARDRDVILLNNDTEIDDPRWVEKLRASAHADPRIGVVGCRVRQMDSPLLQHVGTFMPDFSYWGQQLAGGEADVNQFAGDRDVEGVVFACVYLKREALEKVGFLDEDYFSYYEDTDYCFKALAAGFRVVNCGAVTIAHRQHGSTTANKANFNEMFQRSRETFLAKWKPHLDSRRDLKVTWHSTFSRPVGYAMASRAIAKGLDDVGVAVSYRYLYGAGTVLPIEEDRGPTEDYRINVIRQREPDPEAPAIIFGQADAFAAVQARHRIGWTMLETTGVPAEWVRQCNEMDEVWVPSAFNEWTFRRSGVTRPIRVMPLGVIDTGYFNPQIRAFPVPGEFTFLSVFEWGERKAPEVLIRAFNKAFRATDRAVLLCKFVNSDPGISPRAQIARLGLDPKGGRIVFSENDYLPYYQLASLYRSSDCFVFPSRGEGWGMPILEAMACAVPVIASYWSAQQSFMTDANSYPLQVGLTPAEAKCPYYEGFQWADPSEEHLVRLLRHVFEHPEEARAKGRRAADDVKRLWSMEASAARVREVLGGGPPKPTVAGMPARPAAEKPPRRIAIDVSRGVGHQVTGVGRYVTSLVRGIARAPRTPQEYLLLPGFGPFVHPDYLRPLDFDNPDPDRFTVYRGPLPAAASGDTAVPGVSLIHCTSNAWPDAMSAPGLMVVYDMTFITHAQHHTEENIRLCRGNFERAVLSEAHFCAISRSSKDDLVRHYNVDPDRVTVTYCGVDEREFHPRSAAEVEAVRAKHGLRGDFYLFVGSLEPRKNVRSAIEALARMPAGGPLVIAGAKGWSNSELHELIGAAGARVKLLGYVDQADLPALYTAALATVYPSLYEGFGYPVVESMACGTPVITSDNSSLTEIAKDASLLLADPLDPAEIARAMERIRDDARLRATLAEAGLARAREFTLERMARDTLAVYSRILG